MKQSKKKNFKQEFLLYLFKIKCLILQLKSILNHSVNKSLEIIEYGLYLQLQIADSVFMKCINRVQDEIKLIDLCGAVLD